MKTSLTELRLFIRSTVVNILRESLWDIDEGLPPWQVLEQIVYAACSGDKSEEAMLKQIIVSMSHDGPPFNDELVMQYVADAQLSDSDPQKEGMGTSDYADLALEELRSAYEAMGIS